MATPEQNKAVVLDYYRTAFAGDPERAVREHFGPVYIQHNPQAADGPEAFINFVHSLRAEHPDLTLDIKRAIAGGDMVTTHAHLTLTPGEPGLALADFFRLENGKVVEHWDVIQPVPENAENANGMF